MRKTAILLACTQTETHTTPTEITTNVTFEMLSRVVIDAAVAVVIVVVVVAIATAVIRCETCIGE